MALHVYTCMLKGLGGRHEMVTERNIHADWNSNLEIRYTPAGHSFGWQRRSFDFLRGSPLMAFRVSFKTYHWLILIKLRGSTSYSNLGIPTRKGVRIL